MSAPYNYAWTGNTLTFSLPPNTEGVKLEYSPDGVSNWVLIYYTESNPQTSCTLSGSWISPAYIKGQNKPGGINRWDDPVIDEIVHV